MTRTRGRVPRFVPFIVTGILLGALAALTVSLVLPAGPSDVSGSTVAGYLAAVGGLLGGVAGAAVAVLVDARSRR